MTFTGKDSFKVAKSSCLGCEDVGGGPVPASDTREHSILIERKHKILNS